MTAAREGIDPSRPGSHGPSMGADDLAVRPEGPVAQLADELFERYSPYPGEGLRNHCRRLFTFLELQRLRGDCEYAPDLVYGLAMLHDTGLFVAGTHGANYQLRSADFIEREFLARIDRDHPVDYDRRTIRAAIVDNHHIIPTPGAGRLAEAFRRAVWIEHSLGRRKFGLPKSVIARVFEQIPRANFNRVMLDFWWKTFRYEPWTVIRGVFFRGPSVAE